MTQDILSLDHRNSQQRQQQQYRPELWQRFYRSQRNIYLSPRRRKEAQEQEQHMNCCCVAGEKHPAWLLCTPKQSSSQLLISIQGAYPKILIGKEEGKAGSVFRPTKYFPFIWSCQLPLSAEGNNVDQDVPSPYLLSQHSAATTTRGDHGRRTRATTTYFTGGEAFLALWPFQVAALMLASSGWIYMCLAWNTLNVDQEGSNKRSWKENGWKTCFD